MINRNGSGIACALGAATLYGLVPNVVRGAYNNGVPAIESIFARTCLVAVCFAVLAILKGDSFRIPRQAWPSFLGQTLATLVVSIGYLASVQFIPVGLAVIIFYTFPVIVMLAAPLVEGHSPGILRTLIAIFAFAGLALSVGPSFDSLDIRGILLAAAAAFGCALQCFSGRAISNYMTPAVFGSLVHAIIWVPILLIALWAGNGTLAIFPGGSANSTGLAFVAASGVVYVISYMFHMLSVRFAPASVVAPFFNMEPIVATVIAAFFLGERLALNQYAGGGMVLAALAASSFIDQRKPA